MGNLIYFPDSLKDLEEPLTRSLSDSNSTLIIVHTAKEIEDAVDTTILDWITLVYPAQSMRWGESFWFLIWISERIPVTIFDSRIEIARILGNWQLSRIKIIENIFSIKWYIKPLLQKQA